MRLYHGYARPFVPVCAFRDIRLSDREIPFDIRMLDDLYPYIQIRGKFSPSEEWLECNEWRSSVMLDVRIYRKQKINWNCLIKWTSPYWIHAYANANTKLEILNNRKNRRIYKGFDISIVYHFIYQFIIFFQRNNYITRVLFEYRQP